MITSCMPAAPFVSLGMSTGATGSKIQSELPHCGGLVKASVIDHDFPTAELGNVTVLPHEQLGPVAQQRQAAFENFEFSRRKLPANQP